MGDKIARCSLAITAQYHLHNRHNNRALKDRGETLSKIGVDLYQMFAAMRTGISLAELTKAFTLTIRYRLPK